MNTRGFTLMEVMVAAVLTSFVFIAASSLYSSSTRMLKNSESLDIAAMPVVVVEQMCKLISVANEATLDVNARKQLDIRVDYAACGNTLNNTPSNFADDSWWHYRIMRIGPLAMNTYGVVGLCDNNPNTIVTAVQGKNLIINLDYNNSQFSLINPSGASSATVVNIHIVTTKPAMTLDTNTALGAKAKG